MAEMTWEDGLRAFREEFDLLRAAGPVGTRVRPVVAGWLRRRDGNQVAGAERNLGEDRRDLAAGAPTGG